MARPNRAAADLAREAARQHDGRFGTQPRDESATIDLALEANAATGSIAGVHARRLRADAARWTDMFFATDSGDETLDGGTGGSAYVDICSSARTAGGMCAEVSEAFVSWMGERLPGVRCEPADFDSAGCDYIPDGSPHTVVLIHDDAAGPLVVDLTHRQFDDGADLPHVVPLSEWKTQWKQVHY